jgi:heat shock factor-binding protein 1
LFDHRSVLAETSRMTDIKQDHKGEDVDSYGISNSADPKNMQELTQYVSGVYTQDDGASEDALQSCVDGSDKHDGASPLQVQTLLQKMQDKFQTMSDQIIGRNILFLNLTLKGNLIKLLTSTDRDKFCDNVCVGNIYVQANYIVKFSNIKCNYYLFIILLFICRLYVIVFHALFVSALYILYMHFYLFIY